MIHTRCRRKMVHDALNIHMELCIDASKAEWEHEHYMSRIHIGFHTDKYTNNRNKKADIKTISRRRMGR
jgi:hypothetical protein